MLGRRLMCSRVIAPPMVYIKGEEMTRYTMSLVLEHWIRPHIDCSNWVFHDLSCKARDDSQDAVLKASIEDGAKVGAIFKEPTITPTAVQVKKMGLTRSWGSPNGAMRKGWNGITISRDTIHIDGMKLGFTRPVVFDRQAIGGEYAAGWAEVGAGSVRTIFKGDDGSEKLIDERKTTGKSSCVVTYDNPLDPVEDMAHIFFKRCLEAKVKPYVVTKKTVFKWQEGFWLRMKEVYDEHYKVQFEKELGVDCLEHLISDAATMQIIRWTDGGFGMCAHNYDGDMLTDEIAQIHRSPGFMSSSLVGMSSTGSLIKQFEASHGTVTDMYEAHLNGDETSLNPLGLVEALLGAIQHAAKLNDSPANVIDFCTRVRSEMHSAMVNGEGTRDLVGPSGLTTEQFIHAVAVRLGSGTPVTARGTRFHKPKPVEAPMEPTTPSVEAFDSLQMQSMFSHLDVNGDGVIDFDEFAKGLSKLGVAPKKYGF